MCIIKFCFGKTNRKPFRNWTLVEKCDLIHKLLFLFRIDILSTQVLLTFSFMFQKTVLPNGLQVVTYELESTQAATVLILAHAGSRYEQKRISGISHFLEHMFFKGAKKYKNTKEVSEAIDNVGGDFNAFTGKEYVGYYVKVAAKHVNTALDVLSDMLIHSKFDTGEIDKERGVIMEEYNMYQDTPMYQIGWNFERLLWGDQPMGWDQVGTRETIMGMKREDFVTFQQSLYVPSNLTVAVAGRIKHDEMVKQITQFFVMEDRPTSLKPAELTPFISDKRLSLKTKKTEQAHLSLGFPAYAERDPRHWAAKVLSVILGGNMSSRMFLSVREAQGLTYYISTTTDDYTDVGHISTNAGVDLKRIDDAIIAIIHEYEKITQELVPPEELKKAKEYIKGKMVLKLEDCEEYAHLIGKHNLLYGDKATYEEIVAGVESVTAEAVLEVARDLFKKEKMYLAIIGPFEDEERFLKLMR